MTATRLPRRVHGVLAPILTLGLLVGAAATQAAPGRTLGEGTVTPSGEAQYTIKLFAPTGPGGLTPDLALVYRHRAGTGILGVGWNIAGLSAVARCPKTVAQDGAPRAVMLDSSDRLCLDGQQLKYVGGSAYGMAGSEYRTEIESYARITATGTYGSPAIGFLVETKDGLRRYYGITGDAYIEGQGSTLARAWAISEIRDRANNSIAIEYTDDSSNGSYRPRYVRWGRNNGVPAAAPYQMEFVYEARSDVLASYFAGGPIREPNRVDRIDVSYNSSLVRRYEVTYGAGPTTSLSRIASVQECGVGGGDCLAATTATYTPGAAGWGTPTSSWPGITFSSTDDTSSMIPTDLNGDGISDLLFQGGSCNLRYAIGSASGTYSGPYDAGVNTYCTVPKLIDWNSDGRMDVILLFSGIHQFATAGQPFVLGLANAYLPGTPADYDGDGRTDLIEMYAGQPTINWYRNTGSGFAPAQLIYSGDPIGGWDGWQTYYYPRQVDFNRDGRSDLMVELGNRIAVLISTPSGYQEVFSTLLIPAPSTLASASTTDVNGDGCTDIVVSTTSGSTTTSSTLYRSTCGRTGASSWFVSSALTTRPYGTGPGVFDWDSDGKQDIWYWVLGSGGFSYYALRSTGEGYEATGTLLFTSPAPITNFVDLNGDGQADIHYHDMSGVAPGISYFALHNGTDLPDMAATVTDGFGNAVGFSYGSIARGNYTKYSDATFPYQDYQGPLRVVSQLSGTDGNGGNYTKSYWYWGAWTHLQGRGLQGFYAVRNDDSRSGIADVWYLNRAFPYAGSLFWRDVADTTTNVLLSRDISAWAAHSFGAGYEERRYPYVYATDRRDHESGGALNGVQWRQVTAAISVDAASGTVVDKTETTTEASGVNGIAPGRTWTRRSYTLSLFSDISNWCIGRAQTEQDIRSHSGYGGGSQTRTMATTWNGTYCRPTQKQTEPGDAALQVTNGFEYDGFGNSWRTTVTGIGMTPRVTTVSYGTTGQFPHSRTNAAGEGESQAWNLSLGVPTSTTDTSGLTTTFLYDGFGRQIRETRPDGTYTDTALGLCNPSICDPRLRVFKVENHYGVGSVGLGQNITWLDTEDRPVYDYRWIVMVNAYSVVARGCDPRGRVYTESLPFLSTGTPYWNSFTYDQVDRRTVASRPISASNLSLQYNYTYYEGLRTRHVDAEGKDRYQHRYAIGSTARSSDHNGYYQSFDYDGFDNLVRVMDSAGNTLQSGTFNVSGFRTAWTDADLGSSGYAYNALGEMSGQTDAKGQTTYFTYDLLGRKTWQTEPINGGTLVRQWTYGNSVANKNVGKPTLAQAYGTGVTQYIETYLYDSLGRPSHTEHYDASTAIYHAYDYTYNATSGLLETITYPLSTLGYRLKVQNDYVGKDLWRVRDFNAPGTVFWQANALDSRLNVVDESLGNGLRTTRAPDAVSGWMGWIRTGPGGGTSVQNLNYAWDRVGNLTVRNDANQALTESFAYDNLHRLTLSQLNGTTNLSLSYDQLGNITSKSDVGSYAYGTSRPHAATTAGGNSYAYDANGNVQTKNGASITWYASNVPLALSSGSYSSSFAYTADDQYWRQIATYSNGTETSLYLGGLLEVVSNTASGITAWRHQVKAGGRTVAVYSRGNNGAINTVYPLADHLGSTEVIADSAGTLLVRESFAAFGGRRGSAWVGSPSAPDMATIANTTRRGFTEHTMLDNIGLVHMNGRAYDPVLGRFLSGDPFVDGDLDTQGWNRYSYVQNRPLSQWDPSGFGGCDRQNGDPCVPNELEIALIEIQVVGKRFVEIASNSMVETMLSGAPTLPSDPSALDFLAIVVGGAMANTGQDAQATEARQIGMSTRQLGVVQKVSSTAAKSIVKATRPRGVPDTWVEQAGKKAGNTKYVNPANPHDYVRVKRDGTVTQVRNGKAYDAAGNPVDLKSPAAHGITPDNFVFRE